jgi:hypothetical protein
VAADRPLRARARLRALTPGCGSCPTLGSIRRFAAMPPRNWKRKRDVLA